MTKKKPEMESGISWLGSILEYIKEYGFLNIIKAIILVILLSLTLRICYNPDFLFERYKQYIQLSHQAEQDMRSDYDLRLKNRLPLYLTRYKSDRCWVIQYHNGTLDWQHGSMRFELCREGTKSIKEQYANFNLTWLTLPYYLKDHDLFVGTVEELQEIDPVLYAQFIKNHVSYLACILVRNDLGYPIGIFGNTYNEVPEDIHKFKSVIYKRLAEDVGEIKALTQMNM